MSDLEAVGKFIIIAVMSLLGIVGILGSIGIVIGLLTNGNGGGSDGPLGGGSKGPMGKD